MTHRIFSFMLMQATLLAAADPSTTLWYSKPATSWEREALPIGNGRIGAMIFGGLGHDRIALNEESVWSGSRVDWNRPDASKNLPKIRELLLAGKNDEAEALVNQTFTCTGGGFKGGSRGPWGCFQELGNLNIVWSSDTQPLSLDYWKYKIIEASGGKDTRQQNADIESHVAVAIKPETPDAQWTDYQICGGKAVKGARTLENGERVVLRHHLRLSVEQLAKLGNLRIGNSARQGKATCS